MKVTQTALEKLKSMQPELIYGEDELSGCFYLSCTSKRGYNKSRYPKVVLHKWDVEYLSTDLCFIHDYFYIHAKWKCDNSRNFIELESVREISGKIENWLLEIPAEYHHSYSGNRLCLANSEDMLDLQKKYQCFAEFFNMIVSQYFYYMAFIYKHKIEPWEADRHRLFKALELAYDNDIQSFPIKEEIRRHLRSDPIKLKNLLERTGNKKIKNNSICPFCSENKHSKKSRDCRIHKKQIKGYNKILRCMLRREKDEK